MIQLEDQIRRYAIDVAGPPVGDPPVDLFEVGGRHPNRGRWLLAAALVLFVGGLTYLVARPDAPASPPTATSIPIPQPTSWPGATSQCTSEFSGLLIQGTDGEGICVGIGATTPDRTDVSVAIGGQEYGSMGIDDCQLGNADWRTDAAGYPVGDRSAWFWMVSDQVATLVASPPGGATITASTFELPGIPGHRFAAFWVPNSVGDFGPIEQYTATGVPFVPQGEAPDVPSWCPEHQQTRSSGDS